MIRLSYNALSTAWLDSIAQVFDYSDFDEMVQLDNFASKTTVWIVVNDLHTDLGEFVADELVPFEPGETSSGFYFGLESLGSLTKSFWQPGTFCRDLLNPECYVYVDVRLSD